MEKADQSCLFYSVWSSAPPQRLTLVTALQLKQGRGSASELNYLPAAEGFQFSALGDYWKIWSHI